MAGLLGLALFTSFSAAEPATATGLEFVEREIALVAKPEDTVLEAAFAFVNRADRVVVVEETKASCGCTVPTLEKKSYEPGETGEIRVTFTIGARQGPQRLSVRVRTDAGEHELVLRVDIPPRVTLQPRLLLFRAGESDAKIARATYHVGTPITLLEPRNLDPGFTVTVREVEAGKEFELSVTYVGDSAAAKTGSYELRSRDASGREHSDRLYLRYSP